MILEAPILPTLLHLAAPNVLNLLAIAGMITFDGLFIGRLGADALAGVSLAFPWVMLVQHTGALLAVYWLDAGAAGFFIAVAAGFAMYGALTAGALIHIGKSETQR
jgi:hypothetical protein